MASRQGWPGPAAKTAYPAAKQTGSAASTRTGLKRSPCHPAGTLITVAARLYSTYRTRASWVAAALAAAGLEQAGGAQDQQGGGVAQLERGDADHQPPDPPAQDRSDPDADRLAALARQLPEAGSLSWISRAGPAANQR